MVSWLNAKVIAAIPIFVAVNIAALSVWQLNISEQAMPLILGVIAGGLVDLDNRLTGRLKNVFYTLIAFSISSLCVQLTLGHGVEFLLLMTLLTFIFTMVGAIGQNYSTITFGTLVVALYTTLTYTPNIPWYINPVLILFGTLLYSVCTVFVHLIFPNRPVQENMAKAFLSLAEYLDTKSLFFDPDDIDQLENKRIALAMKNGNLINAFNACRTALFHRIRGQHRHARTTKMIKYYFVAQDIHERINSSHFNYQQLAEQLKNTDLIFRIQRLLELQAQSCREIADSLQYNKIYSYNPRLEQAIVGINQSFEIHYQHCQLNQLQQLAIKTLIENLQSVDWQLRYIDQNTENSNEQSEGTQIYTDQVTGLKNMWHTIRSHLTFESQLFRHAVRLSIVVFISCSLVEIFNLQLGYWILLTAVFVCQPNYSATKLRLKQRIIGTILGVIVSTLLPYIHPTLELQLGLVVATSTLFFFFRSNNYSYSTFFITLQVLISFNIMGFDLNNALLSRLADTLIGSLIAWIAVSYLWPDWKYLQLDKVIKQAIKADAKYFLYIISQLLFGKGDPLKYRIARRKAHEYATALSTTLSNMNSEPKKYQAYLQEGFELVKINYSLLSYISALGAYRKNMQKIQQSAVFLGEFYPIAKKLIYILEHVETLERDVFEKLLLNIEFSLKQFNDEQSDQLKQNEVAIPLQQLNLIYQILPALYTSFQQNQITCKTNINT
ncbi:TIGR01666 family membrane protein [Canicola haemoglobinophilus]|uniref:Inner membrane protein n=1 Tax=Canicola haemoglobinophilus TaxID=733 RepID=A0A1V4AY86_9PAST|nr:YccS family putative transporter [Canicola haemoglobinophilus]OOR95351.1 TIGR01666 family membrane protein [Canicola haemoglobinophilus]STO54267.1 inner membrane protein [Canicola haemoglobinophilus]STO60265.1 inner membrane protein [Canicola haemoglobinophilus]STO68800.1 inner membrane protein [Canicola haemoglobinophilus]